MKTTNKYAHVVNSFTYKLEPKKGHMETTEGESETIPGESYTIREIYERSARGIIDGQDLVPGQYDIDPQFDSIDLEKINHLDFTEIEETKLQLLQEEINTFRKIKKVEEEEQNAKSIEAKNSDDSKQKKSTEGTGDSE